MRIEIDKQTHFPLPFRQRYHHTLIVYNLYSYFPISPLSVNHTRLDGGVLSFDNGLHHLRERAKQFYNHHKSRVP